MNSKERMRGDISDTGAGKKSHSLKSKPDKFLTNLPVSTLSRKETTGGNNKRSRHPELTLTSKETLLDKKEEEYVKITW